MTIPLVFGLLVIFVMFFGAALAIATEGQPDEELLD